MVRTTKNKATWFAALAMAMVLVFGQIPSAAIAEVMNAVADSGAPTEVVTATEGEPEEGTDEGAAEAPSTDGEKNEGAATTPEESGTTDEPASGDEATTDDATNAGEKTERAEGTAEDDAAADDEQATAEEAPEVAGPAAYANSPEATNESGVTVKLFDYVDNINTTGPAANAKKTNVNHAALLQSTLNWNPMDYYSAFQFNGRDNYGNDNPWNKWTGNGGDVFQGIVSNKLGSNGYPTFSQEVQNVMASNSKKDMEYLFTESTYAKQFGVSNPDEFLSKTGNNYSFDSAKNFAQYDAATGRMTLTSPNQAAVTNPNDNPQFAPFDELNNGSLSGSNANYAFGMTVEATFRQPQDGKVVTKNSDGTTSKEDMVFNFSGDDDVWLYIDGALVLDIGGIHNVCSGSINFATGDVLVTGSGNQQHKTTLTAMMQAALGEQWVKENMEGNTFKDFSNHTMKFFYLERGHGGSNCKLDFNLETVPDGVIDVHKKITDSNTADFTDAQFKIRVDVASSDDGSQPDNIAYAPYKGQYQVYDEANNKVGTEQTTDDGTFTLKNGQYARLLKDIKATSWYKVTELAADGYDKDDYQFSLSGASVNDTATGNIIGQSNPVQVVKNPAATVGNKFTKKNKYAFVVAKQMADGQKAPEGATFTMHVTSGDNKVYTGKYYLSSDGGKTFDTRKELTAKDGNIVLKVGQAAKIVDVDPNTTFNVEETGLDTEKTYEAPSYKDNETADNDNEQQVMVNKDNQTGTITVTNSLKTVPATVENQIHVKKTVSGRDWKDGETFSFKFSKISYQAIEGDTVEKSDDNFDAMPMPMPTNAEMTISKPENGNEATNTFGAMEFKTPGIYTYKVVETTKSGDNGMDYSQAEYEVVVTVTGPDDYAKLSAAVNVYKVKDDAGNEVVKAEADNNTAAFVNSVKTGTLTLTKNVVGTAANKDQHFTFSITGLKAGDKYTAAYDGNDGEAESQHQTDLTVGNDGALSVNLKHNETVTIEGLPGNAELKVTEDVEGLQVSKTVATGGKETNKDVTADEGKVTDDYPVTVASNQNTAVTFTNTTNHAPSLGISSNIAPLLGLLATAGIGGTALAVTHRPRGKHARHGSWKE